MSTPTLINLPPPPSDPATPSELGPGTPNSTTTSISELSTVAIKDGHRGHPHSHPHAHPLHTATASTTLDAERADRISRLAGLERVGALRSGSGQSTLAPGAATGAQTQGYFDSGPPPQNYLQARERSTVGSASATGSIGGRTTWASESDVYDPTDKMSEDQDMETSSAGGFSDEGNASLVGFGETASSTVSGPVSAAPGGGIRTPQRQSANLGALGPASPQISGPPPSKGPAPGTALPYLRGSGGDHKMADSSDGDDRLSR